MTMGCAYTFAHEWVDTCCQGHVTFRLSALFCPFNIISEHTCLVTLQLNFVYYAGYSQIVIQGCWCRVRKNDLHLRKKYVVPFEEYHNFKETETVWPSNPCWPLNRTGDEVFAKQEGKDLKINFVHQVSTNVKNWPVGCSDVLSQTIQEYTRPRKSNYTAVIYSICLYSWFIVLWVLETVVVVLLTDSCVSIFVHVHGTSAPYSLD